MSDKIVEGEIVGGAPEPEGAPRGATPEPRRPGAFFHPLSGAVILGADWLAFGMDWASGFLLLAITSVGVFAAVFAAVSRIQRQLGGDDPKRAAMKALIGALAAGVPFPITGTVIGGAILALSGLSRVGDLLKKH